MTAGSTRTSPRTPRRPAAFAITFPIATTQPVAPPPAAVGGARVVYPVDLLGYFDEGKEADFVALDWNAGQLAMRWHQSLLAPASGPETIEQAAQLLFGVMAVGDDRNVDETWV